MTNKIVPLWGEWPPRGGWSDTRAVYKLIKVIVAPTVEMDLILIGELKEGSDIYPDITFFETQLFWLYNTIQVWFLVFGSSL